MQTPLQSLWETQGVLLQGGLCKGDGSEPGIAGAVPGPRVSTEQEVITPCT